MKSGIQASLSAIAAATLLMACASKPPATPPDDETAAEYQHLVDTAGDQPVCKKQTPLGTRVPTVVCFTQAELKAQREHRDEVMRDLQNGAATRDAIPNTPPPPPTPPPR